MLFLVVSTPRPERPSDLAAARQSFWPWIAGYQASGACRHVYARAGRGAVAIFDVENNDTLHRILNEWADIIPLISTPIRSSTPKRYTGRWRRRSRPSETESCSARIFPALHWPKGRNVPAARHRQWQAGLF